MASMPTVQVRVGYADLPDLTDDGRRYEIHGGQLVVVPSPLPRHQMAVQAAFLLLHDYQRQAGGLVLAAPLDIVFDEFDVAQSDVVYFRAERRHLVDPDAVTRHPPDLAVEVLSPSTAAADRGRKTEMFAAYGVPEYWIVDPISRRIEVRALDGGAYRLAQAASAEGIVRSVVFPNLTFAAARLFTVP